MPQAAVAAAAAAASLTAARLGASPDAIADAVAVAVHNVWRWASPPVQYAAGPVMEADADNLDTWWAEDDIYEAQTDPDEGPADAAAEIQEELGVTVQLMGSVKGEDPKAAAVELQVAAVEQSGISELCVARIPASILCSRKLCAQLSDASTAAPETDLQGGPGMDCGRKDLLGHMASATAWELPRPPEDAADQDGGRVLDGGTDDTASAVAPGLCREPADCAGVLRSADACDLGHVPPSCDALPGADARRLGRVLDGGTDDCVEASVCSAASAPAGGSVPLTIKATVVWRLMRLDSPLWRLQTAAGEFYARFGPLLQQGYEDVGGVTCVEVEFVRKALSTCVSDQDIFEEHWSAILADMCIQLALDDAGTSNG